MATTTINAVPSTSNTSFSDRLKTLAGRIAKFFKLSPQSDFGAGLGARGL